MYLLPNSALLLLAFFVLSHARHTVFVDRNGLHSYSPISSEPNVCMTPKCVVSAADILTSLDDTVDPCDDFYRFACGGWMKRNDIPEDTFAINPMEETQYDLYRRLKELLEKSYKSSEPPFVKMLKDFYSSCIDVENIEKKGSEPLKTMLSRLGRLPVLEGNRWDESTFDWVDSLISLRKLGYDHNILWDLKLTSDDYSDKLDTIIKIGAPFRRSRSHTNLTRFFNDPKTVTYFLLLLNASERLGVEESTAEKEMTDVLIFMNGLEHCHNAASEFAMKIWSGQVTVSRDPRHTIKELQEEVPLIPWMKYFNGLFNGAVDEHHVIAYYPTDLIYFSELADLINSSDKRVVANYMLMKAVLESSEFLSNEWDSIYKLWKEFSERVKSKKTEKIRWKRCISSVGKEMDLALSSYYVRRYFNEGSKDEAMILVKYIHKELLKILVEETDWMDENTRKNAEEKAKAMETYIGFPKELLNDTFMMKKYENLTITSDNYLENGMALRKLSEDIEYLNLGKPYNLKDMLKFEDVSKVTAAYAPQFNSIIVPAGILHDIWYDKDRPNYLNFGAIGYVIGHEFTHGFDNNGRRYDKDGKYRNWWDKESEERFIKKAQCIIDQYDNYTTDIGMKINGEKTQGENIADNGGLKEAYRAYNTWTKDNGIEPTLPGLNYTQNQLFWLSAANVWCAKYEPEMLKLLLLEDTHSPGRYRVIGPMSNLEEFSKDFKCSADSPMNRKYKCKVW